MPKRRCSLLTVCCFLLPALLIAQTNDRPAYQIDHYTAENGLPQNSVKSLLYTPQGFLWFTTEMGLVCFDGISFKVFDKSNTPINNNRFTFIGYNFGADKYIAMSSFFDQVVIPDRPTKFPFRLEISSTPAEEGFHLQGLNVHNNPKNTPFVLRVAKDEIFMIGNGTVSYYKGNRKRWSCFPGNKQGVNNPLNYFFIGNQLFYLSREIFFAVTPKGLVAATVTGDFVKDRKQATGNNTTFLFWTEKHATPIVYRNNTWYALTFVNDRMLHTKIVGADVPADRESIGSAWYDSSSEKLFLGSGTEGLFILQPHKFQSLVVGRPGFPDNYYSLLSYDSSTILTGNGWLLGKNKPLLLPELFRHSDGYSLARDKRGWIYSKTYSWVYGFQSLSKKPVAGWKLPFTVTQLYFDSLLNTLWIGTIRGLYRLDILNNNPAPVLVSAPTHNISYMINDLRGRLLVGTDKGCYRLTPANGVMAPLRGLSDKYIRSIYVPRPDEIWITTYEDGIFLYSRQKLTKLPSDRDSILNGTHALLEDSRGYFWMSTNKGIFKVSRNQLLAHVQQPLSKPNYIHYTTRDGFLTNEFNGGGEYCAIQLPDKRFAFASLKGVVVFDPLQFIPKKLDVSIFLNEVLIDGHKVDISDTIDIPKNFSQLKLGLSIPLADNLKELGLQYRLSKGEKDAQWVPVANPQIILSSFPSGLYTLEIRSKSESNPDNFVTKRLFLNRERFFYEHPLFRLMVVSGLLGLIYLFTRIRIRNLKEKNRRLDALVAARTTDLHDSLKALKDSESNLRSSVRLQEKMLASISHDIQSPLRFLMLVTSRKFFARDENKAVSREEVELIYHTSYQLHSFTEQMLQYFRMHIKEQQLQKKLFLLHTHVAERMRFFTDIASAKNNKLQNDIPHSLSVYANEELIGIILHNLIDNANKFTGNGTIRISAENNDPMLVITISDTGVGMPPELVADYNRYLGTGETGQNKAKGLGYEIIRELLGILSATITIASAPEKGTVINIILPLEKEPQG
jgi:signal transduction histidine kinase